MTQDIYIVPAVGAASVIVDRVPRRAEPRDDLGEEFFGYDPANGGPRVLDQCCQQLTTSEERIPLLSLRST